MRTAASISLYWSALALAAVGFSAETGSGTRPWPERPNILWLVAEDLGPYLPPFGDDTAQTPHLSALAAQGVRYTHVFSPSGVCAPSRAALATGQYPSQLGAQHMRTGPWASPQHAAAGLQPPIDGLPFYEAVPAPAVRMHSELLRRAGYYTSNNAKEDYQFRPPATAWDKSGPSAHWRDRADGQPFFSIFNLDVTHESQIWARAGKPLLLEPDAAVPVPPYLPDTEVSRRDVRRMYSNIVEMDRRVGEILAELAADGLVEQTIVVWFTDHGGPLPRQKRLLYDSGLRAPMIIRYPGRWRAGEIDDQLISFVDFKPTLLAMAGVPPPEYVAGRVFVGPLAASPQRRYVHAAADRFDEAYDGGRAVRDRRFKYIRHLDPERPFYLSLAYRERMPVMQELLRLRDAGELNPAQAQWFRQTRPVEELFDTQADPHELTDLATDPRFAAQLAELRAECDRWMAEIGDEGRVGALAEIEMVRSLWNGLQQPTTEPPEFSSAVGGEGLVAPASAVETEGARVVRLESPTPGASIAYRVLSATAGDADAVDGGRGAWSVYTRPLVVPPRHALIARAHRIGFLPSETVRLAAVP